MGQARSAPRRRLAEVPVALPQMASALHLLTLGFWVLLAGPGPPAPGHRAGTRGASTLRRWWMQLSVPSLQVGRRAVLCSAALRCAALGPSVPASAHAYMSTQLHFPLRGKTR